MKSRKAKGFTLVELIIVMAIFSIILIGALNLMNPVTKLFVKTSTQEKSSAASSNIAGYLQGSFQQAEYITVYEKNMAAGGEAALQAEVNTHIQTFIHNYYDGRLSHETAAYDGIYANGLINVLVIDNTKGGKISKWELPYTAGDEKGGITATIGSFNLASPTVEWAINRQYLEDYDFQISLGFYDVDATGKLSWLTAYNPLTRSNFGFTITRYNERVADATGFVYTMPYHTYMTSMAMKNVVDGRFIYQYEYDATGSPVTYTKRIETVDRTDASGNPYVETRPVIKRGQCVENAFLVNTLGAALNPDVDSYVIIYTSVNDDYDFTP